MKKPFFSLLLLFLFSFSLFFLFCQDPAVIIEAGVTSLRTYGITSIDGGAS